MGPHPAVAEVRRAVRRGLDGLTAGDLVLAACSGGADSLALAAALAHEAPRQRAAGGRRHRRSRAPARISATSPPRRGGPGRTRPRPGGGRAGDGRGRARRGRPGGRGARRPLPGTGRGGPAYRRPRHPARPQHGRPGGNGPARPGPRLGRQVAGRDAGRAAATTGARCSACGGPRCGPHATPLGLRPWDDPHNADPAYARARVRHQALPALEAALGPGVAQALARTRRPAADRRRGARRAGRRPGAAAARPGRRLARRRARGRRPPRSGPACCGWRRSRPAARPASSPPGTSTRSMPW